MNISSEQLHTLYQKLSPEMRSVEFTERASNAIRASAEKNKFSSEQTRIFAETIWKTIVGALPKEKIADELAAELHLPPEQAQKVAGEVEKEIFVKVPNPVFPLPLTKGENPPIGGEGVVPKKIQSPPPPPSQARGTPPYQGGEAERKVPIRKEIPPRQSSGQVPQLPTIQSLLADIKKGTAYDDRRINEAYRKTPIEVRQTLESIGFLSRLQVIAKKFALHIDETGELVSESGLVMLGLTQPTQFVENLTRRLRQPRDKTMAIGQAVNMEVFRPVREILRKMTSTTNYEQNTKVQTETGYRFAPNIPASSSSRPFTRGSTLSEARGEGVVSLQNPPTTPPRSPIGVLGTPPQAGGEAEKKLPPPSAFEEQKAKLPPMPEVKKYASDPYREPLE